MMGRSGLVLVAIFGLGCGGNVDLDQARARFSEGKIEEGLAALDRGCTNDPKAPVCGELSQRRAEVDVRAAKAEIEKGEFLAAEGRLIAALTTSHAPTRQSAEELRSSEAFQTGLTQQRTLLYADRGRDHAAIEKLAGEPSPLGAKAKAIVEKERRGWLIRDAEVACDPARLPRTSCTEAWKALKAAGPLGPEADRAQTSAQKEEQRVRPLRKQAESFLPVFAKQGKRTEELATCMKTANDTGDPQAMSAHCAQEVFDVAWSYQGVSELFEKEQNNYILFEKLLASIDDPAVNASLESRRKRALDTGEGAAEPVPSEFPAAPASGAKK